MTKTANKINKIPYILFGFLSRLVVKLLLLSPHKSSYEGNW